ncbi:AaceriAAL107Wp [[Ashbya] aceris (nom. inval.)]|nr:AaceriAAL107Wp [[Ashbya] aceris (nom. inval.)]
MQTNRGYIAVVGDDEPAQGAPGFGRPQEGGGPLNVVLPTEPPSYGELHDALEGQGPQLEMEFSDLEGDSYQGRFQKLREHFKYKVVDRVRERIIDPLGFLVQFLSEKTDYYLSKIGNPLLLRRFLYILVMSTMMYYVMISGLLPNNHNTGTRGMFSEQQQLMEYARKCINFAKMEEDLEYLSKMPHMAGTKGDFAMLNYVMSSFSNNGLKVIRRDYETYINYPGLASTEILKDGKSLFSFPLTEENFCPLSPAGKIEDASIIYAYRGTRDDLERLRAAHLLDDKTVLLMHYGTVVADQVFLAQEFGAVGILFITDQYGSDTDVVQQLPVGLPQYGTGNPLRIFSGGDPHAKLSTKDTPAIPKIPIIPLSYKQAQQIQDVLSHAEHSLKFDDGWHTGVLKDIKVNMKAEPKEQEDHHSWTVFGRIEGKEQTDKAIIVMASRDSMGYGASYPNYGQMMLLSLVELFQQIKYKFDWKPLRNIYFVSFDSSVYNAADATELLRNEVDKHKSLIYSVIDISQLGLEPDGKKRLDIQAHPLIQALFSQEHENFGFDMQVRDVEQYGDWTPYMANSIPVAVLSSRNVLERKLPIFTKHDTFEHLSNTILQSNGWSNSGDLLLVVFQALLKLVDDPLIPFDILTYADDLNHHLEDLERMAEGRNLVFTPVKEGLNIWRRLGEDWNAWRSTWNRIVMIDNNGIEPSLLSIERWTQNKKLSNISLRQYLRSGLPGREFYKNILFGPSLHLSDKFHSWSFPAVRDAIDQGDMGLAQALLNYLGTVLKVSAENYQEETLNL